MPAHAGSFQFRQFSVLHGNQTWPVGTDSILLGSWAKCPGGDRVLDIGTGCGILALMMAQKHPHALVDAVEVQEEACVLAAENFERSPWSERLHLLHRDINDAQLPHGTYDYVISNPPYFNSAIRSVDGSRNAARHGIGYTAANLPDIANTLLRSSGCFATILPAAEAYQFIAIANEARFYVHRRLDVADTGEGLTRLVLLEMGRTIIKPLLNRVDLKEGKQYTDAYKQLTNAFVRWTENVKP